MKCPVCKQEAKAHLYYCTRGAFHVHEKCREKHVTQSHKDTG
jgi:hypothetical protein